MKNILLLFVLFLTSNIYSQTLLQTYPLPATPYWNSAYGMTYMGGKLWISSGSSTNAGRIYGLNLEGQITDSIQHVYGIVRSSQGLAYDGSHFWYLVQTASRVILYKIDPANGTTSDSIYIPSIYSGGVAWDGSAFWVSVYFPNNRASLIKIDPVTKLQVDSIPVFGTQPTGVTVKGDTLFYVMDGFEGDAERIYAVSLATKDTLFSFKVPEVPGQRQNPRGLAWDGNNFWLLAEPMGVSTGRALFKYDLSGGGSPSIQLLTTLIDYGNVVIGNNNSIQAFIKNNGTANLVIDSLFISSPEFTVETTLPLTIAAGATSPLNVKFTPSEFKYYTDSIRVYHNDINFSFNVIRLRGQGLYPSGFLTISHPEVDFGGKRIHSTSYNTIRLTNGGNLPLVLDSLVFGSETFYFWQKNIPGTINTLDFFDLNIWAKPDQYLTFNDTLTIYSNAQNGLVQTVPVSVTGTTFDSTLGNKLWEGVIPNNGSVSFQDLSARFIKRAVDFNGDGINDMIVTTDNYQVIAYNGNSSGTADILWRFNLAPNNNNTGNVERLLSLQIFEDIDNDGIKDILAGNTGGGETVYAISGANGEKIWSYGDSVNFDNGDINGLASNIDFTGDGFPDVLVSASGNEFTGNGRFSVYLLNGKTGQEIWQINQYPDRKMKDAIVAFPGGGAFATRRANVSAAEIQGFNSVGNIVWTTNVDRTCWGMAVGYDSTTLKYMIYAGDINGKIYALDATEGRIMWTGTVNGGFVEDIFVIADVDGDGFSDLLISALSPFLYVLSGANGNTIMVGQTGNNILGAAELGDINADGIPEVGAASLDNKIYVFDTKTGNPLFSYAFGAGTNSFAAESIWMMDDVDGNGVNEFMAGSRDGKIVAFSGGTDIPVSNRDFTTYHPSQYELLQNYPNPFNPETVIEFRVPELTKVTIKIYDMLGEEVKTLVNEVYEPGVHRSIWNGVNNYGSKVSSGVYIYRLEAGSLRISKKMIMMK